jgi:hypothetical protein
VRALSGNNDGIPDLVGDLKNLTTLHLFDCDFSSGRGQSIPSNLGGLTNLKLFRVEAANMVGTVPIELGLIEGLSELRLPRNMLSGVWRPHCCDSRWFAFAPVASTYSLWFAFAISHPRTTQARERAPRTMGASCGAALTTRGAEGVYDIPNLNRPLPSCRTSTGRASDAGEAHAPPGPVGERSDRHHPGALPGEPAAGGAAPQRQPPLRPDPAVVAAVLHAAGTHASPLCHPHARTQSPPVPPPRSRLFGLSQELLNLRDNQLEGLIPSGPYPTTLFELDLSVNALEGWAGGAGFDPSAWTELVNLETLLLSNNNLTWDR